MVDKGELDRGEIIKCLDGFLILEIDRKLFELPVLEERKTGEVKRERSSH